MDRTSRFIKACWGEPHDTIPVWFMRQAGRYQPSYRKLREHHSMLEMAHNPRLIRDVTVRPVEELGVDAAIIFSDIMIPLEALGVSFDIQENLGPIIPHPVRCAQDLRQWNDFQADQVDFVFEGITRVVESLGDIPLIGFVGAPFTLASYLVEGGPSKTYRETKRLMWTNPQLFSELLDKLSHMAIDYGHRQVAAGAAALQVFDSWIGTLSVGDYRQHVAPHMRRIFEALRPLNVPLIYFGVATQHLLRDMVNTKATVLGVDWRVPLADVRGQVGDGPALMGNLDPERVVAGWPVAQQGARDMVTMMKSDPAYIFNLGHGVPKETDPQVLKGLVDAVHAWGSEGGEVLQK